MDELRRAVLRAGGRVSDREHRRFGDLIKHRVVQVKNLAGTMAHPLQGVLVGNVVPRAHAGERVAKCVELVLLRIFEFASLAQGLQ